VDAAGQVPDEPAIDGAEKHLAAFGLGAQAGQVVEHPLILGQRKGLPVAGRLCAKSGPVRQTGPARCKSHRCGYPCQTMALYTGMPVVLSQSTTVSRWLVMPMAAIFWGAIPLSAARLR